ncbi:AAA family ATPase [Halosimplex carlsbadense]|nr:ATP-binding protein [Halosimplex carlsbadense]
MAAEQPELYHAVKGTLSVLLYVGVVHLLLTPGTADTLTLIVPGDIASALTRGHYVLIIAIATAATRLWWWTLPTTYSRNTTVGVLFNLLLSTGITLTAIAAYVAGIGIASTVMLTGMVGVLFSTTVLHDTTNDTYGAEPVRVAADVAIRVPLMLAIPVLSVGGGLTSAGSTVTLIAGVTLSHLLPAAAGIAAVAYAGYQLSRKVEAVDRRIPPALTIDPAPYPATGSKPRVAYQPTQTSTSTPATAATTTGTGSDTIATASDGGLTPTQTSSDDTTAGTDAPDVTFDDVAGMADVKQQLRQDVLDPYQDTDYDQYGIDPVTGVLLHGPPGTGKTYISKAIAGELEHNYYQIDTSDVISDVVGRGVKALTSLFEDARQNQPAVVFIDEIDAIAPERGGDAQMTQSQQQTVNTLLEQLSTINDDDDADVLVIAATNKPEELDDALKRPGRFDTTIEVDLPDAETRLAVLKQELNRSAVPFDKLHPDDRDDVVRATEGMSIAAITRVVEGAERAAVNRATGDDTPRISRDLLFEQLEDVREQRREDQASEYIAEQPDITFDDVGGMTDLKQTLQQKVIDPLENPERYEEYGLTTVNGVLLHGPPGTGKTYTAKALAGETGHTFLDVNGSQLTSKYTGEAARKIADLFDRAVDIQPCILFIDEIDAIAPERNNSENVHQSQEQAVNELLQGMTRIQGEDVVVVAATNKPDTVDDALKRAGRMDEQVEVGPPDHAARRDILQTHLEDRPTSDDINWEHVTSKTDPQHFRAPLVAADIEQIADDAARRAMEDPDTDTITQFHLITAIQHAESSLAGTNYTGY